MNVLYAVMGVGLMYVAYRVMDWQTPKSISPRNSAGAEYDYRAFKAQAMTESNLNPDAKSGVGAPGMMPLMPSTFLKIRKKNTGFLSIDDLEWDIAAGIYYDRALWRVWRESVDQTDHDRFRFASDDGGRVPLLRAQSLARVRALDPRLWGSVAAVTPEVP